MTMALEAWARVKCDCRCGKSGHEIASVHGLDRNEIESKLKDLGWEVVAGEYYCPRCTEEEH